MLRRVGPLAAVLALLVAAPAIGAPARDTVVRPGRSIGDVGLGMTLAQVKATMRPHDVGRAHRVGPRRSLELTWWSGVAYSFTVRLLGRGDELRVVRVSTDLPSERTAQGIGLGTSMQRLRTAYPTLRCRFVETGPSGSRRRSTSWSTAEVATPCSTCCGTTVPTRTGSAASRSGCGRSGRR